MFSDATFTLTLVLTLTPSRTFLEKSPAAKLASARERIDSLKSLPILFFVSTILTKTSLKDFFKASAFFFRRSKPFLAPTALALNN